MCALENYGGIKIDITFQDHNGERCVHLIMQYQMCYQALLPLTIALKQVLYLAGMNDPYVVG